MIDKELADTIPATPTKSIMRQDAKNAQMVQSQQTQTNQKAPTRTSKKTSSKRNQRRSLTVARTQGGRE